MTLASDHEDLPPAPPALVRVGSQPIADGVYAGAIDDLSTATWDGSCGLLSARRLQRKGWLYFGAFSPRYSIGLAVVDAGIAATAFIYLADRESGEMIEEKLLRPLGFAAAFVPDWRRPWRLAGSGREWCIGHDEGGWLVRFRGRRLQLDMRCGDDAPGLTAVSTAPGRPFHHTYKLAGTAARLSLTVDGAAIAPFDARASVDFTLGYPPRLTLWNWASLDGTSEDGDAVAVNLVAHFMNGLENALWHDGAVQPLPQAAFDYDRANPLSPWRVRTIDGRVDVVFTPQGQRAENLRMGVMASVFTQPWGRFEGTLRTTRGTRRYSGYGVVEAHRALW